MRSVFVKCFISFWPDVPSLFHFRFVPISGIIPAVCIQGRRARGLPKFFVSPDAVRGSFLTLDGENAAHAKVLRLRRGDSVVVCDGCGNDYRCTVSDSSPQQVCLVVNSTEPSGAEPPVACSVYMAYAKADKLEHVIQKATELGAYEIAAFPSSRCVLRLDAASAAKKRERWQKIAASAAAQSGRGRIPQVLVMPSFEDAVQRAAGCELALFPYENEHALSLRRAIGSVQAKTVSIMTGPEGGFSDEEVELAQRAGLQVCTLGPRILRCETAPLCALSAVLFAAGALD